MSNIKITITIPEDEFKTWFEFQDGGIESVLFSVKMDLRNRLKQDGVKDFEIEAEFE